MVWEAQVLAACVQVDGVTEVIAGHDGALDVPAGEAPAPRAVPLHQVRVVFFPEREVAGVALFLVRHHIALGGSGLHALAVAGELAVFGKTGDRKVDALACLVSMTAFDELLHGLDLLADVLGGAGPHIRLQQVQRAPVVEQRARVEAGQIPDVRELRALLRPQRLHHPVLARWVGVVVVGEVAHIGNVRDVRGAPAECPCRADDQVGGEKRAEVADVGKVVDRWTARVEAQMA